MFIFYLIYSIKNKYIQNLHLLISTKTFIRHNRKSRSNLKKFLKVLKNSILLLVVVVAVVVVQVEKVKQHVVVHYMLIMFVFEIVIYKFVLINLLNEFSGYPIPLVMNHEF